MRANLRYGLHPLLPARLGFRRLLALTNPRLSSVLRETDAFTLVPARSRVTLARAAQNVLDRHVPGDFVEFGVHRGGTAAVLAALLLRAETGRTLHLFDRWGDLPEPSSEDGAQKQRYARANIPEKLRDLINHPPLDSTRQLMASIGFEALRYYQGWYDDTLPAYEGRPIAFASVDCDYYKSVRLVLDFIHARASPGCIILVDDYGDEWPGAKQATDEFCLQHGLAPQVILNQALISL
jgi:O-methyltransferase